ncbi:MAG: indolepyruvate oxidoreductase subunit beta [Thermodesulfobacteriota bacterium]
MSTPPSSDDRPASQVTNLLFCGVGGQGILLASEITAHALIRQGLSVKKSEVHGMAQRGGSVVAHLRFGALVYSPLIEPGTADLLVAFEKLEAVRYLPYLHPASRVIANSQEIPPPVVATGKALYPHAILDELRQRHVSVVELDAELLARQAGEPRTVNMVLVGALAVFLPVPVATFRAVIEERVPERFRTANQLAFDLGRAAVSQQ